MWGAGQSLRPRVAVGRAHPLLWVVFTAKPAIEKEILTVACGSPLHPAFHHNRPSCFPPPSSAGPSVLSLPQTAGGPSLLLRALPLTSAAGPSTHPAGLSLNLSASSTGSPTPPQQAACPAPDSTVSTATAAILRPLQLQSFVGRTGGLLVCLVCSMPSSPAPPIFSSVRAEVVQPCLSTAPIGPERLRVRNCGQKPPRMTFEANRISFPASTHLKPGQRGGHGGGGGWGRAAVRGAWSPAEESRQGHTASPG